AGLRLGFRVGARSREWTARVGDGTVAGTRRVKLAWTLSGLLLLLVPLFAGLLGYLAYPRTFSGASTTIRPTARSGYDTVHAITGSDRSGRRRLRDRLCSRLWEEARDVPAVQRRNPATSRPRPARH